MACAGAMPVHRDFAATTRILSLQAQHGLDDSACYTELSHAIQLSRGPPQAHQEREKELLRDLDDERERAGLLQMEASDARENCEPDMPR